MTVETTGGSKDLAIPDDLDYGLDEFGVEDIVIPRITVNHKNMAFVDSLTKEEFPSLQVIILGLVKQRTLWHKTVDDGDIPMCKSNDHEHGYPVLDEDAKSKEKRFPWELSNFDPADVKPIDENGQRVLPCARCRLKDWESHPDGKKPYCQEIFTLAIMYDPGEKGNFVPALLAVKTTGLKPLKAYLSSFKRSNAPAYTAVSEITLDEQTRGSNTYGVLQWKKVGDTEPENYRGYSDAFVTMRDFLKQPPVREEEDTEVTVESNVNSAPAAQTVQTEAPVTPTPQAQAAPPSEPDVADTPPSTPEASADPATGDDDDLPF